MGVEKTRRPILGRTGMRMDGIQLSELRNATAAPTAMAAAPSGADLGLAVALGSPIVSTGANNTTVTQKFGLHRVLKPDYKTGGKLILRIRAKVDVACFVSQTLGVSAKKVADGALGSEIGPAAQAILAPNTYVDYDFVIDASAPLKAGDVLSLTGTVTLTDGGGSGAKIASIAAVTLLYDGRDAQ